MKIICLMGATGSGKSTIEKRLGELGYKVSVSYTTRAPRTRDGITEQNGREYYFVSREDFMRLADEGQIIEWQEYSGNLYGTPRLFGSSRHVMVVCTQGLRSLREIYKKQVIGVYVKKDIESMTGSVREIAEVRKEEDNKLKLEAESECDLTVDGNQDTNKIVADILEFVEQGDSNESM